MGAFSSVLGYLIYYYALARIPASRMAAFQYLQPVFATLMAVVLLGEHLTCRRWRAAASSSPASSSRSGSDERCSRVCCGQNRNYRYTWSGQVVSEVGDHFNNIAVMSLAMEHPELRPGGDRRLPVARRVHAGRPALSPACCSTA